MRTTTAKTKTKRAPRTSLETRLGNAREILRLGNKLKAEREIAHANNDSYAEARVGSDVYKASQAFARAVRNFK